MRDFPSPLRDAPRRVWRGPASPLVRAASSSRAVPEETPIAFSYEGLSYAVMMATPADLADFAIGFSLTEGIIKAAGDIKSLEIVPTEGGVLLRMSLAESLAERFWKRRRYLAGPSGCGLCGLETIAEAMRMPPAVSGGVMVSREDIFEAMALLPGFQALKSCNRRLACCRTLGTGKRDCQRARRCWAPQRARQTYGSRRPGRVLRCQQRRFTDEPGIGGDGAESSCSRRAPPGCRLCANRARGPSGGGRRNHVDRRCPARLL